jgi:hypothetical protein
MSFKKIKDITKDFFHDDITFVYFIKNPNQDK